MNKYCFALIVVLTAFAFPSFSNADEIKEINAFDYVLEYEDLIGQSVQVSDCNAYGVTTDFFLCSVSSKTGTIGSINIQLKDLPKKQLKYGLIECASIMGDDEKKCIVTVKGIAGKTLSNDAMINAQELTWHSEK